VHKGLEVNHYLVKAKSDYVLNTRSSPPQNDYDYDVLKVKGEPRIGGVVSVWVGIRPWGSLLCSVVVVY